MSEGMLSVRTARLSEKDLLEELQWRASLMWEEYREVLLAHPDAIEVPVEQLNANQVFVAERDGKIVGFGAVVLRDDGDTELEALFVEPEVWLGGVGRRLVVEAERRAAKEGSHHLLVTGNPRAEGFYLACGFVQAGEHTTRFGVGLRMRKMLAPIDEIH
jgi:N-acetylglutamate synthase-like GNAT family acetyltransferase